MISRCGGACRSSFLRLRWLSPTRTNFVDQVEI
jgi:hypothetical protein